MISDDILNDLHLIKMTSKGSWSEAIKNYLMDCYSQFLTSEGVNVSEIDSHYMVAYDVNGSDHYIELELFVQRFFEDHLVLMHHRLITLKNIIEQ